MLPRAFYARRERVALTGAALATACIMILLSGLRVVEGPSIRHVSELVAIVSMAIALGYQLRAQLRPIMKLSEGQLELGPLAGFRKRLLVLSDVESVEDETGLLGRVWEMLRVRLKSGRSIRIYLTELEQEDRAAVRAALNEAAKV
jgi:hypothetical protein